MIAFEDTTLFYPYRDDARASLLEPLVEDDGTGMAAVRRRAVRSYPRRRRTATAAGRARTTRNLGTAPSAVRPSGMETPLRCAIAPFASVGLYAQDTGPAASPPPGCAACASGAWSL